MWYEAEEVFDSHLNTMTNDDVILISWLMTIPYQYRAGLWKWKDHEQAEGRSRPQHDEYIPRS